MDGNTAAAEQLATRTKIDCITHTIFLADGAFLEPGMIIDRYGSNGLTKLVEEHNIYQLIQLMNLKSLAISLKLNRE